MYRYGCNFSAPSRCRDPTESNRPLRLDYERPYSSHYVLVGQGLHDDGTRGHRQFHCAPSMASVAQGLSARLGDPWIAVGILLAG